MSGNGHRFPIEIDELVEHVPDEYVAQIRERVLEAMDNYDLGEDERNAAVKEEMKIALTAALRMRSKLRS